MNRLLSPLGILYGGAARARRVGYERGWLKRRRLRRPVISIGNLTTGGTGKTPLAAMLARLLLERGFHPAILTRGYGRRRGESILAIEPSSSRAPDSRLAGDEPALLARALPQVPIVVCADRHRGGRFAEEHFQTDAHLLDDGFQHLRLARDVDIVVLDATQELSDLAILPAGRQREPCEALRRADIIILTRVDQAEATGLERQARQLNPQAPIFHSRTKLRGLLDAAANHCLPLEALSDLHVFAFCGVGNPKAFFCDLRRWGIMPVAERVFRDHHRYTQQEMDAVVAGARSAGVSTLVTTEKDLMNLPGGWKADVKVFAGVIDAEMLDPEAFRKALFARLEKAEGSRQT